MSRSDVKISVIIPCYNDGRFLGEAVASVKSNKSGLHELIVVNDGSTDTQTLSELDVLRRDGIRVIDQENRGLGAARNRGIAAAQGEYVLLLDADNRIKPRYIDQGIEILDSDTAVDVVYSDAEYFGDRSGYWEVPDFELSRLLRDNFIDACAIIRKVALEKCGGFDEHAPVPGREDWDLWLRLAAGGSGFHHICEPLFDYRVRRDSMSARMNQSDQVEAAWRHLRERKVQIAIGEYMDLHQSSDYAVEQFRRRPLATILRLVVRAYFPHLRAPRPTKRDVRN